MIKKTLFPLMLAFSILLKAQEKPNIVMIFVDDWAWNGSPVAMHDSMDNSRMPVLQMPNVEKLAMQGMKFGNAFVEWNDCFHIRLHRCRPG